MWQVLGLRKQVIYLRKELFARGATPERGSRLEMHEQCPIPIFDTLHLAGALSRRLSAISWLQHLAVLFAESGSSKWGATAVKVPSVKASAYDVTFGTFPSRPPNSWLPGGVGPTCAPGLEANAVGPADGAAGDRNLRFGPAWIGRTYADPPSDESHALGATRAPTQVGAAHGFRHPDERSREHPRLKEFKNH